MDDSREQRVYHGGESACRKGGKMMANKTITLALSGEVSLQDFAGSASRLHRLVRSLAREVSPRDRIAWLIDGLEAGSAITTIRGVPRNRVGSDGVEQVARAYIVVGQALERNQPIPYSPRVQMVARSLTTVLKRSVESIRFETADAEATITRHPTQPAAEQPVAWQAPTSSGAYGAVEGRVQTLSNRGGLRFTLYDALYDRAVSCYLLEGHEDIMRDAWGKRAVIEGWVTRDPVVGRPQTIRRVSRVTILPEGHGNDFQVARGCLPVDQPDLAPEDVIRLLRDA
jgi:hypothetical protein